MELKEFNNDYRVALIGVLETIKDEFSYLDEDSGMVFDEIIDELGQSEYDRLIEEFNSRFKNSDEFKYFLLGLENSEAIEIIHDFALGITPIDLDTEYTIIDFIEDNFSYLFGDPDPELNSDEKSLFLFWADYLNLLPEAAFDDESNEYMLDIWIDMEQNEFEELYSKIPNKNELSVTQYENLLEEKSKEITKQEIRNYIFDSVIFFADFDLEEDLPRYPQIDWLIKEWNIEIEE